MFVVEGVVIGLFATAAAGVASSALGQARTSLWVRASRREGWARLAAERGLSLHPVRLLLSGRVGDLFVSVFLRKVHHAMRTRVEIAGLPLDLTLQRPTDLPPTPLLFGDPAFHAEVAAFRSEVAALAHLDHHARAAWAEAMSRAARDRTWCHLELDRGVLVLEKRGEILEEDASAALLDTALLLARHLTEHGSDRVANLARRAVTDPLDAVREHALRVLLERFPQSEEARMAADSALGDTVACRLRGATFLGRHDLLGRMARDPAQPVAIRVEALGALGGPGLAEVLLACATDPDVAVRVAAAQASPRLDDPFPVLRALAEQGPSGDLERPVVDALIDALAAVASEEGIPLLLRLLDLPNNAVKERALRALAPVARPSEVRALSPWLAHPDPRVRAAARDVARAVASRHEQEASGALSLADPSGEAGALSLPRE